MQAVYNTHLQNVKLILCMDAVKRESRLTSPYSALKDIFRRLYLSSTEPHCALEKTLKEAGSKLSETKVFLV